MRWLKRRTRVPFLVVKTIEGGGWRYPVTREELAEYKRRLDAAQTRKEHHA